MDSKIRCVFIGAGNVATHLARALSPHVDIVQVFSRDINNASTLALALGANCRPTSNLSSLVDDADLYIISVTDSAISQIIASTSSISGGLWVHTSGTTPMEIFSGEKQHYGVFYPLQTFSKQKKVDFSDIPIFIEASEESVSHLLISLARKISGVVRYVDSLGRRKVHISAVFACNFVNYLWTEADTLLQQAGLDLSILKPLLRETLEKLDSLSPYDAQTGPARRGDESTIQSHLAMLDQRRAQVYKLLSENIKNLY